MANSYFVSGIGTDIGKTITCAILTEAFKADYWKPIQAGNIESSDLMIIQNLISNTVTEIHAPSYSFEIPASPHFAAEKEGRDIEIDKIKIPVTKNMLFIEGAGGLLVPINRNELVIDLIEELNVPVILVVKNYLGAINHTLLSIEALKHRRIKLAGIIYNGGNRLENIDFIEKFTGVKTLGYIPDLEVINKETISREAAKFAGLKL
jgi:dethiobiotin synthetase